MARWDSFGPDEVFTTLFGSAPSEIDAVGHPPEERLKSYLARRATRGTLDPQAWLAQAEGRSRDDDWSRQAITAHLVVCRSCRERYRKLKAEPTAIGLSDRLSAWVEAIRGAFAPTPRPAMVAMAAQSVVIVGLAAVLLTGTFSTTPTNGASSDLAQTSASTPPDPQVETESVSPQAEGEPAAQERARTAETDASLPDSVAQRIEVLSGSDDPQARLVAARELQSRSDPSLVPELTRIYRQESNPQVQQALNRTINAVMSNMATSYDSALQAIREFQGESSVGPSELMDRAQRQLDQLFGDPGMAVSSGAASDYRGGLVCNASEGLTLAQLRHLSDELGGMMVVNPSLPEDSFQMRLPLSAGLAESLRGLEDEMGLRCYQE